MNAPAYRRRSCWPATALALLMAALLAACASTSPLPGSPGRASPSAVSPLVTEQRWLDEWFRGTPVVIALTDVNTLAVDVPLVHSFESGQSSVKPALAAVLDRVATSLRRQASLRVSITAPSDGVGSNAALVSARARQVRKHLVSRGVASTRVSTIGRTRPGAPVELRLMMTPPAIERLGDASLRFPFGADACAGTATAAGAQTVANDAPSRRRRISST